MLKWQSYLIESVRFFWWCVFEAVSVNPPSSPVYPSHPWHFQASWTWGKVSQHISTPTFPSSILPIWPSWLCYRGFEVVLTDRARSKTTKEALFGLGKLLPWAPSLPSPLSFFAQRSRIPFFPHLFSPSSSAPWIVGPPPPPPPPPPLDFSSGRRTVMIQCIPLVRSTDVSTRLAHVSSLGSTKRKFKFSLRGNPSRLLWNLGVDRSYGPLNM